jgi:hypothetical protein
MMAKVSGIFTPAEVKYYNITEREAAIEWILYGIEKSK